MQTQLWSEYYTSILSEKGIEELADEYFDLWDTLQPDVKLKITFIRTPDCENNVKIN